MARPSHSPPSLALWPRQPCGSVKRPPSCAHSGGVSRAVPSPRVAGSDALGAAEGCPLGLCTQHVPDPVSARRASAPLPRSLPRGPGGREGLPLPQATPCTAPTAWPHAGLHGRWRGLAPRSELPSSGAPARAGSEVSEPVLGRRGGASRGLVPMLQREGRTAPGRREGLVLGADLNVHLKVLIY